jgi:phosphohistidine swiveling domain-containing protein
MPAYVYDLTRPRRPAGIGGKAEGLRFLMRHRFRVPATLVCTWDAYLHYVAGDRRVVDRVRGELLGRLTPGRSYAVRSSANVEDQAQHSFAGQFQTFLDVQGIDEVLEAIQSIWALPQSPGLQAYVRHHGLDLRELKMAVLVQEMVSPHLSGVAFSKNPTTGLDEVVVEAVRGSGEALVQEGITPSRWVNKWGTWIAQPQGVPLGQEIPLGLVEQVVRETRRIAKAYGRAVDLEWVYDGQALYWVQVREVTALEFPLYSNRISKEVFPGPIQPLIWSVNVPLVNGAWVALLTELVGPNDMEPQDLAGRFYGRAYFNMTALGRIFELLGLPRETLELLMGIEVEGPERPSFKPSPKTYSLLPRMLRFGWDKVRFAPRVDAFLPDMQARLQAFRGKTLAVLDERQLLDEIDRLYPLVQQAAYYNIVVPLLMQVYNRVLKGQLERQGVEFERFDLTGDMEELEAFEPNVHLACLSRKFGELEPGLQARIRESSYQEFLELPGAEALRQGLARFLEQFGHFSDSGNDFSHAPWRENPDLILRMVTGHTTPEERGASRVRAGDLRLPAWRKPFFRWVYHNARRFRWYREAVSSLYTFGYGLFRPYFLALGERLVRRGLLAQPDDLFLLYLDEVRQLVEEGRLEADCPALIGARRAELEQARDIVPPSTIFGAEVPPVDLSGGDSLQGIPTSRGQYTGPVKVLTGLQDFGKLQKGDVLVIPYSDVGWTPLFAQAGAVVAESGGILSHSSIVAREVGIPAVVSVPGACQLQDGVCVTVDGYRGEVVIHGPTAG